MSFEVRLAEVFALLSAGDQRAMFWVMAKRWEQRAHTEPIPTRPDVFAIHRV
jgi:uncharacterized protein YndB with AHSA1/START domain